jgi:ankyrin repeat protein
MAAAPAAAAAAAAASASVPPLGASVLGSSTTAAAVAAMSASAAPSPSGPPGEYKDIPKLPRIKQDDENMEKMHLAARRGHADGIRRLVANGVDAAVANKFGATAFNVAVRFGKLNCVQELLNGPLADVPFADLLQQHWHGRRPLLLAIEFGHLDVFQYLVAHAAAKKVHLATIVNETDDYLRCGSTLLGETIQHFCVSNRKLELVQLFQRLGASPNAKDRAGETVLMRAVREGLRDEFFVLVEAPDLKVDAMDRNGTTAIMLAIEHGHEDMALKLVALGSDVNARISVPSEPTGVSMPFLATRACMVNVINEMLPRLDPYCIQEFKMRAFEATSKDQMPWYPFTNEQQRQDTVRLLQETLFASPLRDPNSKSTKNKVRWQYKDEDGVFKDMSVKDTKSIDTNVKNNPGAPFRLKMANNNTYLIDVNAGTQTNMKSGKAKAIKRVSTAIITAADIAGSSPAASARPTVNVRPF